MTSLLPDSTKYDLARQLRACQSVARRNGKVARLPFALRDQINRMIDDGVPYKLIIEKLGPAARHLTEQNLSNWRLGGYQDYLKAQAINDRARTQTETAAEVVREAGHPDPVELQRICGQIALVQYMNTLMEHGEQHARDALKKNPAKMITLINACSNMSNANIAIEKSKWREADRLPSVPAAANPPSPETTPHESNPIKPDPTPKNCFPGPHDRSNR